MIDATKNITKKVVSLLTTNNMLNNDGKTLQIYSTDNDFETINKIRKVLEIG